MRERFVEQAARLFVFCCVVMKKIGQASRPLSPVEALRVSVAERLSYVGESLRDSLSHATS